MNMLIKIVRILNCLFSLIIRLLFSFHNEKIVAKQGSKYNKSIIISKCGSKRLMRFNNLSSGAQSEIDLNQIDYPTIEYIQLMLISLIYYPSSLDESNILIIGLGGGVLPRALRKVYPMSLITIIEIDPIVNQMAKKYFHFQEDSKMKVLIKDGRQFLFNLSNQDYFDIIYFDAYDSTNGLPNHMKTQQFFIELKNHLNGNGGLVIINLVTIYQSYLNILQTIYSVFGLKNLIQFRTKNLLNMILVASPSLQQFDHINQKLNFINQIKQILSIDVLSLLKTKEKFKDLSTQIYTDQIKTIQNEEQISFTQFLNNV
jgi:spermidine synthase